MGPEKCPKAYKSPGNLFLKKGMNSVNTWFSCWSVLKSSHMKHMFLLFHFSLQYSCLFRVLGMAGNQAAGSSLPVSPKLFVKQESSGPSATPKLTIKSELLERTVVSQTVSTTVVHVS